MNPITESVTYILDILLSDSEQLVGVSISLPLSFLSIPEVDQVATALIMTTHMEGETTDIEAWQAIVGSVQK